jgi:hypothetical protein
MGFNSAFKGLISVGLQIAAFGVFRNSETHRLS